MKTKFIFFTSCLFLSTFQLRAQYWNTTGNAASATDFIGTTNAQPLKFKVQNMGAGYIGILDPFNPGSKSTYLGWGTGISNPGRVNTGFGFGVLMGASGEYNCAFGNNALSINTGDDNSAFGSQALGANTSGHLNVAIGSDALTKNTTGNSNVAIGVDALFSNIDGMENTGIGYLALRSNKDGYWNVGIGSNSLYSNTTGSYNIGIGNYSLNTNTTGNYNTALGGTSLQNNGTGVENVAMGYNALRTNSTGNRNTAIGTGSGFISSTVGLSNTTALGAYSTVSANNQVRIGNSAVTSIGGFAGWTNVSDGRFKKDIEENVPGLEFIKKLRPVTYKLDMDKVASYLGTSESERKTIDETEGAQLIHTGFIAQEVEKAAEELNYDFSGVDKPKNSTDYYGLRYAEFTVPLIKAVQEQQKMIDEKDKKMDQLQQNLAKQQAELNELKTTIKKLLGTTTSVDGVQNREDVALLEQNIPNPFSENTIIHYYLPDNIHKAVISIISSDGKEFSKYELNERGKGQLILSGSTLDAGTYIYNLIIDGKVIDSKKLMLIK